MAFRSPRAGLVADLGRDAVGAVEQRRAFGHFVERLDEHDAAPLEALDDVLVVDDLVIDVERGTEEVERPLQALDRHVDAGAEAAGIGQDDLHRKGTSRPGPRLTQRVYAIPGSWARRTASRELPANDRSNSRSGMTPPPHETIATGPSRIHTISKRPRNPRIREQRSALTLHATSPARRIFGSFRRTRTRTRPAREQDR